MLILRQPIELPIPADDHKALCLAETRKILLTIKIKVGPKANKKQASKQFGFRRTCSVQAQKMVKLRRKIKRETEMTDWVKCKGS